MSKLSKFMERVTECENQLQQIDDATEKLNNDFAKKTQAAGLLEASLKKAQDTLFAAENLLG